MRHRPTGDREKGCEQKGEDGDIRDESFLLLLQERNIEAKEWYRLRYAIVHAYITHLNTFVGIRIYHIWSGVQTTDPEHSS